MLKLKYTDNSNPNDQVQEIEEMTTRQIDVLRKIHEERIAKLRRGESIYLPVRAHALAAGGM